MKIYSFSEKDNIYKIFHILEKLPKKQKEVFLKIDPKNEFFSNRWWLKLVLEKTQDIGVKPIFVISTSKQEKLLKLFGVNYIWEKEPFFTKIKDIFLDFLALIKANKLYYKYYSFVRLFIIFFEIGLLILVGYLIYNFVTPRTDIYIQPSAKIKQIIQKVYMSPSSKDASAIDGKIKVIKFYTGYFTKIISAKLPVKDIKYFTNPSKGTVKIVNYTTVGYSLKAYTKLITDNGLIFKMLNWVYVPAAKSIDEPGTAIVKVIANDKDIQGDLIGARGNVLKGTKMYIKNLYVSTGKKKIYAIAKDDFVNGNIVSTGSVTVDDIKNSQDYLDKLLNDNIKKYILQYIREQKKDIYPLSFSGMYSILNKQFFINAKPGDKQSYISSSLQAKIMFSYVQKEDIKNFFNDYLKDHIVNISDFIGWNETSLNILDFQQVFGNLYLATLKLDAILGYDFDVDYNGIKNQILQQILGLSVEDAKKIILSYPQIAGVEIKTTNSLNKISNLASRIYIHIVK